MLAAGCAAPPEPSSPQRLFVFDVSDLHLDHFALCGGPCSPDTPPPNGKSYAGLLRDYDTLIFLSSLQGIVNRKQPRLYLIHHPTDRFWLETYQTPNQPFGWLAHTDIVELASLEEVLDTFVADVDGLVEWDADVPATLNVATTIAGVEGWPIVRRDSDIAAALMARWPGSLQTTGPRIAGRWMTIWPGGAPIQLCWPTWKMAFRRNNIDKTG